MLKNNFMKPIKPIFLLGLLLAGIVIVKAAVGVTGGGGVVISPGGGSSGGATITNTATKISTNLLVTAVPSATIGGTNVLEVVNQNTNKVFVVNTNSYSYFGSNVVINSSNGRLELGNGTYAPILSAGGVFNSLVSMHRRDISSQNYFSFGSSSLTGAGVQSDGGYYWSKDTDSDGGLGSGANRRARLESPADGTVLVGTNLIVRGTITATNGVASYRSNSIAPTTITFPATTVNWTNPISTSIQLYIDNTGVTGTAIKKNGGTIGVPLIGSMVTIGLQPNEYFSVTYTAGTPVGSWSPFP